MNQKELKQRLLNTGYFIDNNYLNLYCNFSLKNINNIKIKYITEKHHFIPVCCYQYKYKLNTRKEAEKLANTDINNFIINLPYKDHLLVHYYLSLCTKDHSYIQYVLDDCFLTFIFGRFKSRYLKNWTFKDKYEIINKLNLQEYQRIHTRFKKEQALKK